MADYSAVSVFWMYTLMFLFAAGALGFLYWAVKSGAVANDEAPKFRMLEDDAPLPSSEGDLHGDNAR